MPDWLIASLIASAVLTVGLNLVIWLFPGLFQSAERRLLDRMEGHATGRRRVRVVFPWKTMLVISVLGTVLLNLIL